MSVPRLAACAAFCAALALPPAASAAGPPLPSPYSGREGAVAPGGTERLVTRRAGRDTLVLAVRRDDRDTVLRRRRIAGRWAIPAVTVQGGTTGLSANGATLALAEPVTNFPPAITRLAILDARSLVVKRDVTFDGFFTVDAISPDGSWLFVLQYAGGNFLDYRVRALDTRTGRLAAHDIVDPREPDEQMGGLPMLRTTSRDGRWAYTFYAGGRETFIHALDTVGRTAACIDLEMIPPHSDVSGYVMPLSRDGRRLTVRDRSGPVAFVDTRTFDVREPGEAPAPERPAAVTRPTDEGGFPWPALAAAALAVALVTTRRRRASRTSARR